MTKKILIPVADPDFSLQILPTIKEFFPAEDSELILLRVESEADPMGIRASGDGSQYIDEQSNDAHEDFRGMVLPLVHSLEYAGYRVTTRVKTGEARDTINELISTEEIDLVAMTTHGRRGLDKLIHGSVAEYVLHHCSIPVLLLHATEKE